MTERTPGPTTPGLPSPEQVTELLSDSFGRAGYDIESVTVDTRSRPARLCVVADGDTPLDLDTAAALSRSASDLLDTLDTGSQTYLLEVTSPGVDRPLSTEKHFRRARGRRVDLELRDGTTLTGRLGQVAAGHVDLVVRERSGWAVRAVGLADIRRAVVQVEFNPPNARELELAGTGTVGAENIDAENQDRDVTHP